MAALIYKGGISHGQHMFALKISKEYKEKLDFLRDQEVKLGASLRPKFYAWIDEAISEINKK